MATVEQDNKSREVARLVVKLYLDGMPVKQIVSITGVNTRKIYEILKAYGVGPSRRKSWSKRRVTREEMERIKKLYLQGCTIYEIARRTGRPVSTVYYVLKKLGLR